MSHIELVLMLLGILCFVVAALIFRNTAKEHEAAAQHARYGCMADTTAADGVAIALLIVGVIFVVMSFVN